MWCLAEELGVGCHRRRLGTQFFRSETGDNRVKEAGRPGPSGGRQAALPAPDFVPVELSDGSWRRRRRRRRREGKRLHCYIGEFAGWSGVRQRRCWRLPPSPSDYLIGGGGGGERRKEEDEEGG